MQASQSRVDDAPLHALLRLLRSRLRTALALTDRQQFEGAFALQEDIDGIIEILARRKDDDRSMDVQELYAQCLDLNDLLQENLDLRRDELTATIRAVRLENSIAQFLHT